jgi:Peptidase C65 Otubain
MALFNYFEIPMKIVYLDNTLGMATHDLTLPEGHTSEGMWLLLLYRPGHYDLIYDS